MEGVVSGLGVVGFGSAFGGQVEILDSIPHVGVMAAVRLACLSMYGRLSIFEQIKYKSYQGFCR